MKKTYFFILPIFLTLSAVLSSALPGDQEIEAIHAMLDKPREIFSDKNTWQDFFKQKQHPKDLFSVFLSYADMKKDIHEKVSLLSLERCTENKRESLGQRLDQLNNFVGSLSAENKKAFCMALRNNIGSVDYILGKVPLFTSNQIAKLLGITKVRKHNGKYYRFSSSDYKAEKHGGAINRIIVAKFLSVDKDNLILSNQERVAELQGIINDMLFWYSDDELQENSYFDGEHSGENLIQFLQELLKKQDNIKASYKKIQKGTTGMKELKNKIDYFYDFGHSLMNGAAAEKNRDAVFHYLKYKYDDLADRPLLNYENFNALRKKYVNSRDHYWFIWDRIAPLFGIDNFNKFDKQSYASAQHGGLKNRELLAKFLGCSREELPLNNTEKINELNVEIDYFMKRDWYIKITTDGYFDVVRDYRSLYKIFEEYIKAKQQIDEKMDAIDSAQDQEAVGKLKDRIQKFAKILPQKIQEGKEHEKTIALLFFGVISFVRLDLMSKPIYKDALLPVLGIKSVDDYNPKIHGGLAGRAHIAALLGLSGPEELPTLKDGGLSLVQDMVYGLGKGDYNKDTAQTYFSDEPKGENLFALLQDYTLKKHLLKKEIDKLGDTLLHAEEKKVLREHLNKLDIDNFSNTLSEQNKKNLIKYLETNSSLLNSIEQAWCKEGDFVARDIRKTIEHVASYVGNQNVLDKLKSRLRVTTKTDNQIAPITPELDNDSDSSGSEDNKNKKRNKSGDGTSSKKKKISSYVTPVMITAVVIATLYVAYKGVSWYKRKQFIARKVRNVLARIRTGLSVKDALEQEFDQSVDEKTRMLVEQNVEHALYDQEKKNTHPASL